MTMLKFVHSAGLAMAIAFSMGAPAAVSAQQSTDPGYILGPGDGIQVIIYGQPEAGVSTRIKSDGTIMMPFIGSLNVSGINNIDLAKRIAAAMEKGGYLRDPLVNVEVTNYSSKTVNVAGNVGSPGIVPLDKPYRALEVLLKSGWIRGDGAEYVYLRRQGKPEARIMVEDLVRGGLEKDPLMVPGDTLYVPPSDKFYVYGAIKGTGVYPIRPGMTVRQALTLAGGVSQSGSMNKVSLLRGDNPEVDADLSQTLQRDDVLVVKERLF
jgi:polysaccharide export outer membrane protein